MGQKTERKQGTIVAQRILAFPFRALGFILRLVLRVIEYALLAVLVLALALVGWGVYRANQPADISPQVTGYLPPKGMTAAGVFGYWWNTQLSCPKAATGLDQAVGVVGAVVLTGNIISSDVGRVLAVRQHPDDPQTQAYYDLYRYGPLAPKEQILGSPLDLANALLWTIENDIWYAATYQLSSSLCPNPGPPPGSIRVGR